MNAELHHLWMLQRIEDDIAEMHRQLNHYPRELERLQNLLQELAEQRAQETTRIEQLERDRRRKEGELELENGKIRKAQLRLMEAKTNKEYQALLKEIEFAKDANSHREDEIIAMMDDIDRCKENLEAVEKRIAGEKKEIEDTIAVTKDQIIQLETDLARTQDTRSEITGNLDRELLNRYVKLKERKDGVAVVLVKNEACQGCYVNIPPQLYNEVQKNTKIIFCPNCQRILYWENKDTG